MKVAVISPHPLERGDSGDRARTRQLRTSLRSLGVDARILSLFWGRRPPARTQEEYFVGARPSTLWGRQVHRARSQVLRHIDPAALFDGQRWHYALRSLVGELEPDVVDFQHSSTFLPGLGVPSVVTLHNVAALDNYGSFSRLQLASLRRREQRVVHAADEVVVFSERDAAAIERAYGRRAMVVPIGFPATAVPRAVAQSVEKVAFLGSVDYEPNREAATWLIHNRERILAPGQQLVLIGRRMANLPTPADVVVRSDVEDIAMALADVDAMLVPLTNGGGARMKILDAMARQIPVVTTPVGCAGLLPEEVEVQCFAIGERDRFDELLRGIADTAPRRRLVDAAVTAWQKRFAPEVMAAGMIATYRSVLR